MIKKDSFTKTKRFLLIGMTLSLLSLSCQRDPITAETHKDEEDLHQITVHLPQIEAYPKPEYSQQTFPFYGENILPQNTAEIFLWAEGLVALGDQSDHAFFTDLGHHIIDQFYETPDNYTSYRPLRTPYIQSALAITELERDHFLLNKMADQIAPVIPLIEEKVSAFDLQSCNPLSDDYVVILFQNHDYNLDCYFNKIKDEFLRNIHDEISQIPNISDALVSSVRDTIENEYIPLLDNFQFDVENALLQVRQRYMQSPLIQTDLEFDPQVVNQILTPLAIAYNNFLDEFLQNTDAQELKDFKDFVNGEIQRGHERLVTAKSKIVSGISAKMPLAQVFLDVISHLSDVNAAVSGAFNKAAQHYGQDESNWDDFFWSGVSWASGHLERFYRNSSSGASFLSDIASKANDLIYRIVLIEHANGLNTFLPQIPKMVASVLVPVLEEKMDPINVYDSIHDVAEEKAIELAFHEKPSLPGIEFSNVAIKAENQGLAFFRNKDDLITNGVTLGTAMSAVMERLKGLERSMREEGLSENEINKNKKQSYQLLFSLFNKSIRLIGFKTFIKSEQGDYIYFQPQAFFRPIWREQYQDKTDNLRVDDYFGDYYAQDSSGNWTTQQGYFAIPDYIVLWGDDFPFDIDLEQTHQRPTVSTVTSQAEMIRGAAKVLRYLRPDQLNAFTEGLGDEKYEGEDIFPRDSMFNLHLAIAAINLINLSRRGVTVYNADMESTSIHNIIGEDVPDGTFFASVHDVVEYEDNYPRAKTADIAGLMIALEEFIVLAKDLNLEDMYLIGEESLSYYRQIKEGIALLNTLSLGLITFMISKLQREDGSFVSQYSIEDQSLQDQEPLSFDVQLQAMRALIATYKRTGGDTLKASVLRSFHQINERLFEKDRGFYVALEGSDQSPNLRLTTDFFRLLFEMDVLLDEDEINLKEELNHLRHKWISDFARDLQDVKESL